jgi:phenylacetate-CoA ligase
MSLSDADFWPPERIAACQQERWVAQRDYLVRRSPFYQRLWGGLTPPERVDDLAQLPLTTKAMVRESQAASQPFGEYLAAPLRDVVRLHRTSGTTGQAMNIALSAADAAQVAEVGGRAQRAAGLTPDDLVVHCLNYQIWLGGVTDHMTLEATGATVIPFGVGGTQRLIDTIRDLKVSAISCTPSYPAVLERVIADRFPGLAPRDLGLRLALFGGEPGLDNPGFRGRLEGVWGFAARNANYGMSDVMSNFASQCAHDTDLHFLGLDLLYPELIDPETEAQLPWQAGSTGELVLTHLARQCQPLVRFRSNDTIVITATEPCACGRTVPRFRVLGRSDDMIVVRGVNVFPTAVGGVLAERPELSGEYRIVLEGSPPYDRVPVEAELAEGYEATPALAAAVADTLKARLGASAAVTLLAPLSLPRTEGKTQRLFREEDER